MDQRDEGREPTSIDARGIKPPAAYSIAEREADGVSVVAAHGELDIAAAPLLRARVDAAASGGRALVIDLEETTFIDSAVLKELLRARAELAASDVRLILAAVPQPVRRLLDLTRTSELFEDAPNVDEAIKRLS